MLQVIFSSMNKDIGWMPPLGVSCGMQRVSANGGCGYCQMSCWCDDSCLPFSARAGHFFCHESPVAVARELFKVFTDSASLLVSIKK